MGHSKLEYSIEKIKENIERLKREKEIRDSDGQEIIFDNKIAEEIGLSSSTYCKRIQGHSLLSAEELTKIANFFGVTCDEVITGVSPAERPQYENSPVDKSVAEWINQFKYECPDSIALFNIIFNKNDKNHLGERLIKTILYYCYGDIFKISSVSDSTPLNVNSSIRMLKLLALDDLSYLLDDIAKEWRRKMESPDTALEKTIREKKQLLSTETRRRLRIKAKSNLKMKKNKVSTVKLINLVEDLGNDKKEYAKLPKRKREQTSPAEMYETLLDSRQALTENWSSIQTELSKEEINVFEKVIHKLVDTYGTSEEQENLAGDSNEFLIFEI